MISEVVKHIKGYIAQVTDEFNVSKQTVEAELQGNKILITGLEGEYTLVLEGNQIANKQCFNQTFNFIDGSVTTDCYLGEGSLSGDVVQVNCASALNRDLALAMIEQAKGSAIVVYMGKMVNGRKSINGSLSEDRTLKLNSELGVMFKVDSNSYCSGLDSVFIDSVTGSKVTSNSSLLVFDSVVGRGTVGNSVLVEYLFTYQEQVSGNVQDVKNFIAELNNLRI